MKSSQWDTYSLYRSGRRLSLAVTARQSTAPGAIDSKASSNPRTSNWLLLPLDVDVDVDGRGRGPTPACRTTAQKTRGDATAMDAGARLARACGDWSKHTTRRTRGKSAAGRS